MANYSETKRNRVIAKTGGRCGYCGVFCEEGNQHIDHIVPRSRGGGISEETNLILACVRCNTVKGALTPQEFTLKIERRRTEVQSVLTYYDAILANSEEREAVLHRTIADCRL